MRSERYQDSVQKRAQRSGWVFLSFLAGALAALPVAAATQQVTTATYPLVATGTVVVENIRGSLWVEAWDRAAVEVTIFKSSAGGAIDLNGATVVVEASPAKLVFRTFHSSRTGEPVRVDYRLRVPRQARLGHLRTLDGDIVLKNLEGAVEAYSLSGSIEAVGLGGPLSAHAMSGDIRVQFRRLPEVDEPLELETVNGTVSVVLPPHPNVELAMSTVAGRVETPYLLRASEQLDDSEQRARVGRGGVLLRLRTVRGDIRVTEQEDDF